jgi:hypothetical protein
LSTPSRAHSLSPLRLAAQWGRFVGANSSHERVPFFHYPAGPARSLGRSFARPLSLARGPCPSNPPSSSTTATPMACALAIKPAPMSARPAHVARALGKDPAHSLSSPLPHIRAPPSSHSPNHSAASPRCRFTVLPSPLDFCQRFGHGELRLSLAHREPTVVSPFLNSTAWSTLSLFLAQVGARRRRDSSTPGQPEPPRVVPSLPKHRLRVSDPPSLFCANFSLLR